MKFNKEVVKKAHAMAREIKKEYVEVDYKTQFGLCLSYLLNKKGDIKMKELEGTEKQIKWAKDIKEDILNTIDAMEDVFNISKRKDEYIKISGSIRNIIKSFDKAIHFIGIWEHAKVGSSYYEKCIILFNRMYCMDYNPAMFKNIDEEDKKIINENDKLLRELEDWRFQRLHTIYIKKTGKEI